MVKKSGAPILILLVLVCLSFVVQPHLSGQVTRERDPAVSSLHTHEVESMWKGGAAKTPFEALPSGWDESAVQLYEGEKNRICRAVTSKPDSIITHEVLPLGPVRTSTTAFVSYGMTGKGAPFWEPETFVQFFKHLARCRYYVGFGTWLGPTLFFAAQMVEEAYGIEADPVAFAAVETNLALNMHTNWASRVHLNPHAVGITTGSDYSYNAYPNATRVEMRSAGAGSSCSGLGKVACGKVRTTWKVNTYSLSSLLNRWNVPVTNQLFVKVDVESFECLLLPSWLPWLRSIKQNGKPMPTFHIAFHGVNVDPCTEQQYQDVYQLAKLFDNVDKQCMDHAKGNWTCLTGEFVFFDNF